MSWRTQHYNATGQFCDYKVRSAPGGSFLTCDQPAVGPCAACEEYKDLCAGHGRVEDLLLTVAGRMILLCPECREKTTIQQLFHLITVGAVEARRTRFSAGKPMI